MLLKAHTVPNEIQWLDMFNMPWPRNSSASSFSNAAIGRYPGLGHDQGSGRSTPRFCSCRFMGNELMIIAVLHTNTRRSWVGIVIFSRMHFLRGLLSIDVMFARLMRYTKISADVIKIEHPTRGDDTRAWGPPYAKHVKGNQQDSPGESAYFLSV